MLEFCMDRRKIIYICFSGVTQPFKFRTISHCFHNSYNAIQFRICISDLLPFLFGLKNANVLFMRRKTSFENYLLFVVGGIHFIFLGCYFRIF